jgi:hypothetical protein
LLINSPYETFVFLLCNVAANGLGQLSDARLSTNLGQRDIQEAGPIAKEREPRDQ